MSGAETGPETVDAGAGAAAIPVPTIAEIQAIVARRFRLRVSDLKAPGRARRLSIPRQMAMHIARALTGCSLATIGRAFGGRDHTTVLHAVRQMEKLCATDRAMMIAFAEMVRDINAVVAMRPPVGPRADVWRVGA